MPVRIIPMVFFPKQSEADKAAGKRGMFYDSEAEAFDALGPNIRKINVDPNKALEAGITNPINCIVSEWPFGLAGWCSFDRGFGILIGVGLPNFAAQLEFMIAN